MLIIMMSLFSGIQLQSVDDNLYNFGKDENRFSM